MRRCCPSYSTRSHPIKTSAASPPMVPSIRASATRPLPPVALPRSFRPTKKPNHGSPTLPGLSHGMKLCAHLDASVEPSGDDGGVIIAGTASRRRCTASNCWANVCLLGASTVRSPSSKSVWLSRIASQRSAYPSPKPWDESAWGKGRSDRQQICATEPCSWTSSWCGSGRVMTCSCSLSNRLDSICESVTI